jgi:cell division protein FtsA/cell division protein FtsZ
MPSSSIIVGLEIGTAKVCAAVGEVHPESGALNIVGLGQARSRGVRKGEIVDAGQVEEDIRNAIVEAEQSADIEVRSVFLGVTGGHVRGFNNRGVHPVVSADREITDEDVQDVVKTAKAINLPPENHLIHAVRQHFLVDGQEGVPNPVGMHGARLEVDMHVVHGNLNRLRNALGVVRTMRIEVEEIVFNGLAASLALLNNEQKELGALVIDLGGGATEYVVYADGVIRHTGVLAVGGDHVTNDLAFGLKVSQGRAEALKLAHGGAWSDEPVKGQTISLPGEAGLPPRTVNLEHLRRIMSLRLEEVFQLIEQDVDRAGLLDHLRAGVFLCGGGAHIPHLEQLAGRVFHLPVAVGRTSSISGLKSHRAGQVRLVPAPAAAAAARPAPSRNPHPAVPPLIRRSAMTRETEAQPEAAVTVRVFGIGGAGCRMIAALASGAAGLRAAALHTDARALAGLALPETMLLGRAVTRGLSAGGDPERGKAAVEEAAGELEALCGDTPVVVILAGLGGGTGTGGAPALARIAKAAGALVLGVVSLPFDFEGARRRQQSLAGLEKLRAAADAVVCVPNQDLFKLAGQRTTMVEGFEIINRLVGDAVQGLGRLLTRGGLLKVDFADLREAVAGGLMETALGAAEAAGPQRARDAAGQLLRHPFLQAGEALDEADTVLVSIVGGPDLTLTEVNEVMEPINRRCDGAQVLVGALTDPAFSDRLGVTLLAARRGDAAPARPAAAGLEAKPDSIAPSSEGLPIEGGFNGKPEAAPGRPRFVPPPPELTPEARAQIAAQNGGVRGARKRSARWRQTQLPLELISKGRFEKSEPTIHHGEDLDIPTYIRRGVPLN